MLKMPIYEFRCNSCRKKFEKLCSLGEKGQNITCPQCGQKGPSRVMSCFCSHGGQNDDVVSSGGGSGCGGCTSTSCAGCGH